MRENPFEGTLNTLDLGIFPFPSLRRNERAYHDIVRRKVSRSLILTVCRENENIGKAPWLFNHVFILGLLY